MAEEKHPNVSVKLVPLVEWVRPGENLEVAVVFEMAEDWHIYWQNPGDAGMATYFDWNLPEGFEILSKQEPAPERLTEEGITTFIHKDEAIYLFTFQTPDSLPDHLTFDVQIDWLECKSICLAGSATLSTMMPVSYSPHDDYLDLIELGMRARSRMPLQIDGLSKKARIKDGEVMLKLGGFHQEIWDIKTVDFFPAEEMVYDIQVLPRLKKGFLGRKLFLTLLTDRESDPTTLKGVLAIKASRPLGAKTQYFEINQPILP